MTEDQKKVIQQRRDEILAIKERLNLKIRNADADYLVRKHMYALKELDELLDLAEMILTQVNAA